MKSEKRYNAGDLEQISLLSQGFIDKYRDSRILVAGATGFVGSWIISAIDHMNRFHGSNIEITGISRNNPDRLTSTFTNVKFTNSDISKKIEINFVPDCIFNAATPSSPAHGGENPEEVLNAAIQGTRNLIGLAHKKEIPTFVNLSSGIVTKRHNDQYLDISVSKDSYLAGKRESEKLVEIATYQDMIKGQNLRLYSFAGPGISLVDHFAVGNFLNDAMQGRPISIKGNPETKRSYLYPTDMLSNILASAVAPAGQPLEIGSTNLVTMEELASLINYVTGNDGIHQSREYGMSDEYFPASNELLINQEVNLESAISKWVYWLKRN